jgi:hypothetical protein
MASTSTRSQRKAHYTSFHFVHFLFHSAGYSPPAALVVLACAVVRAAGCHDFCIRLVGHRSTNRFQQPIARSKKSRQPLLVSFVPHFTHGSLPRSFVPQSRSLLTPYLLLASHSVEATSFALGGSHGYNQPPHF